MPSTRRWLLLLLPWIPAIAAVYVLTRPPADNRAVRFALYRPSVATFFLDMGVTAGVDLGYAHTPTTITPFGVPGDVGLVCPQNYREKPLGLRVFVAGRWFFSGKPDRPSAGDLTLGQPGDLPFCADFDGDGRSDSGVFRNGEWLISTRRAGSDADIRFRLGTAGDRPVVLNVRGAGNSTDRRNVLYGVYRRGIWYIDTKGTGVPDATHFFGGLPQDIPLLIPRWTRDVAPGPRYSLAIFRDGTWYVKPVPDGEQTLAFSYGQAGDVPSVDH